jgi:UDP-N-acetylglucosamine acyltransferase
MLEYKKIRSNLVHKTAIINWNKVVIGSGNKFGPYVVIGNDAQFPQKKSIGKIYIGNNNIFNEFVNVHLPTHLRKKTVIGNNNYFMNSVTIDHDCVIENNVILSSNTILGGNIVIMNNAQLGMKTTVHQNQIIGSFSMIGMNSMITKKLNVVPGYTYYGKPAKKIKKNLIGLKRNKISSDILKKEYIRYLALINEKKNSHTSSL